VPIARPREPASLCAINLLCRTRKRGCQYNGTAQKMKQLAPLPSGPEAGKSGHVGRSRISTPNLGRVRVPANRQNILCRAAKLGCRPIYQPRERCVCLRRTAEHALSIHSGPIDNLTWYLEGQLGLLWLTEPPKPHKHSYLTLC
jgi:hypothetical protein